MSHCRGMRSVAAHAGRVALLALVYVAVARLGLLMDAVHGFATLVWPASGIALAALVARRELWPGVALGAFVVNCWVGAPWYAAVGIATGNTLEAIVGAYAVRHLGAGSRSFERLRDAFGLIVGAAILSTTLSATVGVASLAAAHVLGRTELVETARAWWLGDALGDLVVGALLLAWSERALARFPRWRVVEGVALAGAVLGIGTSMFLGSTNRSGADLFLESYALFPPLVWAAVRFGVRGATATTFVVSCVAVAGTALGMGPFVRETLARSLLHLQVFMALVSSTALVLGAAISERTRAVKSRDEVLAIVSHDLRNPLGAVRLSVEAAARGAQRGSLGSVERQLAVARSSVVRMDALVRDLVDLAAIDAGLLSMQPAAEDAGTLVREAIVSMRALAASAEIVLVEGEASPGTACVLCDRQRTLQVFSNLVGNSVKYTAPGGTVTIGARVLENSVEFFVEDTGAGIDVADLRRVFERFCRGSDNKHPGAGLGLFIAKTIVDLLGGEIAAESQLGVGSRFSFTLPRSFERSGPAPLLAAEPP